MPRELHSKMSVINISDEETTGVAPFLGRAAPRPAQSANILPWESRAFPREERQGFARWQQDRESRAADKEPRPGEDVVVAPFGRVPALPGVDVPPPPPFARPGGDERRVVVTVDDPDAEPSLWDTQPSMFVQPRQKPRRRPKPSAIPREVIDVDALPDADEFAPAPRPRRRAQSRAAASAENAQDAPPRRLGRSIYDAVQTHGHFGMVDTGDSDGGVRRLLVHVPKRSRGYVLDIHPGEVIQANSGRGRPVGGRLDVQYVTRHQYFAPGRAVTSCAIGVPDWQWQRFM
jgi:hypothetical protein